MNSRSRFLRYREVEGEKYRSAVPWYWPFPTKISRRLATLEPFSTNSHWRSIANRCRSLTLVRSWHSPRALWILKSWHMEARSERKEHRLTLPPSSRSCRPSGIVCYQQTLLKTRYNHHRLRSGNLGEHTLSLLIFPVLIFSPPWKYVFRTHLTDLLMQFIFHCISINR